ncbi:magnesium transporter CorA family protein [Cupriavidus sp. AU9028]|uniref:magnesium transporter CorA family protein n=1 Tax=Cupriavidus sp. AU9028 TaxID=2871157 RepID=UPI001C9865A6|nr:magnesium transporter CorA family protein [Cupriavidus sp. AU9028]MBY4898349.1 magnesium transporter CorA family protein [Cupriavidus sp. AU9028]
MQVLGFSASQVHPLASLEAARDFLTGNAAARFVWIDCPQADVAAEPAAWRERLQSLTGAPILDLHLKDALNVAHPSFFDTTNAYDMVIFRKLTFETSRLFAEAGRAEGLPLPGNGNANGVSGAASAAAAAEATGGNAGSPPRDDRPPPRKRQKPGFTPALARIDTQPVTFFVFDNVLVTVRPGQSRTIDQVRQRLLELDRTARPAQTQGEPRPLNGGAALVHGIRPPTRPEDLMLRLLNAMVDRYLELRAPLTRQLDRWQRALLNARSGFSSWEGLLDARIQLRRLEHLCEEQRDALQEFRDSLLDNRYSDPQGDGGAARDEVLLVRINDVMEHILRVLAHARRLEDSIESAVQIHFSAVAHRTNNTMRALTMITALFMPLTLITGIFGMNFERMPWLARPDGFWLSLGLMGGVIVAILAIGLVTRLLRRE